MMKNISILLVLTNLVLFVQSQTLINTGQFVQTGSYFVLVGGTKWQNNGTAALHSGSEVWFLGNATQEIDGTNPTAFANLRINNSSAQGVVVRRNIQVIGTLTMQQGFLDLKNNEVDFSTTGTLTGETETRRVRATDALWNEGGGTGRLKATRNNPSGNVAGMGLTFTPSINMGNTTIYRGHQSQSGPNLTQSIFRYFDVYPTTYANLNINPFSYFDAELNNITPESDLKIVQLSDNLNNWQPLTTTLNTTTNQAQGTSATTSVPNIKLTLAKSPCVMTVTITSNAPLCEGNNLQLQSVVSNPVGNITYTWSGPGGWTSNAQNPVINNATPTASGTYYVTISNEFNCSATTSANIIVNPTPTINVSSNSPVCGNGTLNLSATGGTIYNWSGPNGFTSNQQNPSIPNPSGLNAGQYSVTVIDANGCSNVGQTAVVVNSVPELTVTSNSPLCSGQDIELTSSSAVSWIWTGPNGWTSNVQNPIITNAQASHSGTYSVTITDVNGCTNFASTNVVVNEGPTANAGVDQTIPYGTFTTLNGSASGGSGNYSYNWQPTGSLVNPTVQNPTTTNLTNTTSFILMVTDNVTGCKGYDTVVVYIQGGPLTVIVNANPNAICAGESVQLEATASGGSGSYTYSWSSNPTGFNSNLPNPVVSPTVTTTYTVTVNDGFNSVISSVVVTVNPLPNATITPNNISICEGGSTTLTASGGNTYEWSNGSTTNSIQVSPSITTIYTVTVTTSAGCSATANATVTVNPLPNVTVSANPSTICSGASTTLTATGASTYVWSHGLGTNSSVAANPSSTTTYTVTATNANGCTAIASIVVTVNPSYLFNESHTMCEGSTYVWHGQTLTQSGTYYDNQTTSLGCDSIYVLTLTVQQLPVVTISSSTNTICAGNSVTLTASGASSYVWSSGHTTSSINVSPTSTTTYTVTGTSNGCSNTANIDITVNPLPNVTASASPSTICSGTSTTLTVTGASTYLWSHGLGTNNTVTVNPTATITYTVTGTDANGCTNTSNVIVTVTPSYNITQSHSICQGESYTWNGNTYNSTGTYVLQLQTANGCDSVLTLTLTVHPKPQLQFTVTDTLIVIGNSTSLLVSGANNYIWSPATGLSCTNCSNPTASPETTTNYCVIGTTNHGCSDTACITIHVDTECGELFLPLAFSPNGDGNNDVWKIYGRCIKSVEIAIFNRWGEKVFESYEANEAWDGTFRNKALDTDVFVYVATITMRNGEVKKFKGDITLLR